LKNQFPGIFERTSFCNNNKKGVQNFRHEKAHQKLCAPQAQKKNYWGTKTNSE
jgi:hypothetical protein